MDHPSLLDSTSRSGAHSGHYNNNNNNSLQAPTADDYETNVHDAYDTFDDEGLGLKQELLRSIYAYGFESPSAIQQRAVKPLIDGHDVIAQAQSGSGKTAAFLIGTIQTIDTSRKTPQAIVLAPTRELANQIHDVATCLGDHSGLVSLAMVGGTSRRQMADMIRKGIHLAVCTPGRAIDMIQSRQLPVEHVQRLVIDEADEMLSVGFKEQVYEIFQFLHENVQVALFSATLPREVLQLSEAFMRNPKRIMVKNDELTLQGIQQFYVGVGQEEYKLEVLEDLYGAISVSQSVIFCNTRRQVQWLGDEMQRRDHTVSVMHADLDSAERASVMREFKTGSSRVLIATDVLARGIDVQTVSLIINYDLPNDLENYLHRIGRSGRFGRKGIAINFLTERDVTKLRAIEQFYSTQIEELPDTIADFI